MVALDLVKTRAHLLELTPCWVFLVELPSVVGEEKEGEDSEEDTPEGSPETDVID